MVRTSRVGILLDSMLEYSLELFSSLEASVDFLDANGSMDDIYSVRETNLFSAPVTPKVSLYQLCSILFLLFFFANVET